MLYQSGYTGTGGTSNYTSVNIYPTATGLSVSSPTGGLAAPLINLNGADNVTLDGRFGGVDAADLTLANTSTSAGTLQFIGDASSNTITYCNIKGSTTSTTGGVIFFSTGTTTGNDNNAITYNNITNNGGSRPYNTIYSVGSSATIMNTGNTVSNNQFYNFLSRGGTSFGINLGNYNSDWAISGNSFYDNELATFIPTAAGTYNIINVASGNNYTISGNYIGGGATKCGNPAWIKTNAYDNPFYGINMTCGTTTASTVTGNTIQNISWSNSGVGAWYGISAGGWVNVGTTSGTGNTVGSITYAAGATNSNFYGIQASTTGTNSVNYNTVSGISCSNSVVTNVQNVYGLRITGTAALTVNNNTIATITNNSTAATSTTTGMSYAGGTIASTVSGNFIYSITAGSGSILYGINKTAGKVTFSNNIITLGNNTSNTLYGIYETGAASNNTNLYFNTVYIGGSPTTTANKSYALYSAVTTNTRDFRNNLFVNARSTTVASSNQHYAIWLAALANTINYNDYWVSGTGGTLGYCSGNQTTIGSWRGATSQDVNSQSVDPSFASAGGTAAINYAPQASGINGTSATGIATDYFGIITRSNYTMGAIEQVLAVVTTEAVSGIGATTATGNGTITSLGIPNPTAYGVCWSSTNATPTISDSKVDNGAASVTGAFTAAITGLTANKLYYVRAYATNVVGTVYGAVVTFNNYNYWYGTTSTDWNTTSNWSLNMLPASGDDLYFAASPFNHCLMDQNRIIGSLHNDQATYRLVTNGHNLTLNGSFNQTNGAQVDASASGSTITFGGTSAQTIPTGTFYNNQVVNMVVNNSNNVTLYGNLSLSGSLTATSGALDADSQSPSVTLNSSAAQTIESNTWLNNRIYNLTNANTVGVTDNALFTVSNNLILNSGSIFTINAAKTLNVNGTLTNNAGASGLVIASNATGTGSLVHSTDNVPSTVNRYIDGSASAWHFLSSPVAGQAIHGTDWTPAGTYGDGTGYDMYVWDEPASCWIYNLNTTVAPTWTTAHPSANYIAGRGYLYAVQATTPTKQFVGNLNNGTVNYGLSSSATGSYKGFNLIGNPYPSSIDWKIDGGYSRSQLELTGGGYNIWIWSATAGNYGVYNSAFAGDAGTNNVTRYIPPMEGFFVKAASAGTFSFYNACRVHNEASNWLKVKSTTTNDNLIKITVNSDEIKGQDEVMLYIGSQEMENGATKIFNTTYGSGINKSKAPNLFLPCDKENYSIRYVGDTKENSIIPLNIKVLKDASYVLHFSVPDTMQNAVLEDRLTGQFNQIVNGGSYSFKASTTDQVSRFNIRFGSVEGNEILPILIYRSGDDLIIDALAMKEDFQIRMLDLTGRNYFTKYEHGGTKNIIPVKIRQMYIITVTTQEQRSEYKIIF